MLRRLDNAPRDYAWGSTHLIADLQGRAAGAIEAEVWLGDHPGGPSLVDDGSGRRLDAWLGQEYPHDAPLPYLLKILAAGSPLSIQAHPSKHQAEEGFAREEKSDIARDAPTRTYRDDNHKPELIVALSDSFSALAGLRHLEGTRRLLNMLGDGAGPRELFERLSGGDETQVLRETIAWLLSGAADAAVVSIIDAVNQVDVAAVGEFADELRALRKIAGVYPADPGVVVALLMNLVQLQRGEAVFVDAGVFHAYLEGLGVELMAASDNVLRGGLTPKYIDVAELLAIADTTPAAPPLLAPRRDGNGEVFTPGIPDFALTRVVLDEGARDIMLAGPAILLATAGEITLRSHAGEEVLLTPGAAAFATSDEDNLAAFGPGELFIAQPGTPAQASK